MPSYTYNWDGDRSTDDPRFKQSPFVMDANGPYSITINGENVYSFRIQKLKSGENGYIVFLLKKDGRHFIQNGEVAKAVRYGSVQIKFKGLD